MAYWFGPNPLLLMKSLRGRSKKEETKTMGDAKIYLNAKNLGALAIEIHQMAKDHGWWPDTEEGGNRKYQPNIPEKLALIHSEVSEALEAYRNSVYDSDLRVVDTVKGKPEGFAVELADTLIRILDLTEYLGIDIGQVVSDKMLYNATREHRHGGKRC